MPDLWHDQIVVVTGAAGSIGSAICDHFGNLGARVAGSDLAAASDVHASARRRMDVVDVTDSGALNRWIGAVSADWGAPTVAVICAGVSRFGRLAELSDKDWREVLAINLDGAFYTARAAIGAMLAAGRGGRVVFVGSWAAHAPHPHIGAYSTSKAAIRALCQTLALGHAKDDILVNEVAPGIVDAGLSRELFQSDPALAERTLRAIPSRGMIMPADVARDVAYLASPENRHTTGAVIVSDGGLSLASTMNPG